MSNKEQYKEGDQIEVRHICTPNLPSRFVTFENGGVKINGHWFTWSWFFKVNFIVK